jgi:hypothetical protein
MRAWALRECLEATQRRSIQHIYRVEFNRFRCVTKTTSSSIQLIHARWYQAFELEPKVFPCNRRHADKLIELHEFFSGHRVPTKNLPASIKALFYLMATFKDRALVEKLIAERDSICQ